jgi:predicted dehydrogenase
MKTIKCAILGFGGRGRGYGNYLKAEDTEFVGIIDSNPFVLQDAKEMLGLSDDKLFLSLEAFLEKKPACDFIYNATMDQLHYETSIKILNAGYNMLLEKPVTPNVEELLEIERLAEEKGCIVLVCHCLRYTPFYRKIKEIIDSGEIGKVMNLQLNEHVWHGHFVNAYVRGKWRNEKECGSGLLLAKSCHDTDLICWLNNATRPVEVASFGNRSFYTPKNAPEGSTEYCWNCPKKDECIFDAYKFHLKLDCCPRYTYPTSLFPKPLEEITEEEKREYLKTGEFGKCVYKTDMDIVDKQSVIVNFANGSTASLNVVGGVTKAGRHIHVICEYGEILGYTEEGKIIYRKFNKEAVNEKYKGDEYMYTDTEIVPMTETMESAVDIGHYGGDYFLVKDLLKLLRGEGTSVSLTALEDSVNSHLVVYAAEKSRLEKKIVTIEEIRDTKE